MAEKVPHILDLNDDCLAEIFMYLSDHDFNQMRKVCVRFHDVVLYFCRIKYKSWKAIQYYDGPHSTDHYKDGGADFRFVVFNMSDVVEHVIISSLSIKELLYMRQYTFLKVKSLKLGLDAEDGKAARFNKVKVLTKIFPNLTKLTIVGCFGYISGMENLHNLVELELYYSWLFFIAAEFIPIFAQLKLKRLSLCIVTEKFESTPFLQAITQCKSLEEVGMSSTFLYNFTKVLNEFPKLRKISLIHKGFHGEDIEYEWNTEYTYRNFAERVHSFHSTYSYAWPEENAMYHMKDLERWLIEDRLVRHDDQCYFENLRELFCLATYTSFERFDFDSQCNVEITIVDIVAYYPKLEVLYVPFAWINEDFKISDLIKVLKRQTDRKAPLQFRYYMTEVEKMEAEVSRPINYNKRPDLINLSQVEYPKVDEYSHWEQEYQCRFTACLKPLESFTMQL